MLSKDEANKVSEKPVTASSPSSTSPSSEKPNLGSQSDYNLSFLIPQYSGQHLPVREAQIGFAPGIQQLPTSTSLQASASSQRSSSLPSAVEVKNQAEKLNQLAMIADDPAFDSQPGYDPSFLLGQYSGPIKKVDKATHTPTLETRLNKVQQSLEHSSLQASNNSNKLTSAFTAEVNRHMEAFNQKPLASRVQDPSLMQKEEEPPHLPQHLSGKTSPLSPLKSSSTKPSSNDFLPMSSALSASGTSSSLALSSVPSVSQDKKEIGEQEMIPSEIAALEAQARAGDFRAQHELGRRYYRGEGVNQDYKIAMDWYNLATNKGNPEAQNDLGISYKKGARGVPKDLEVAAELFGSAAKQGYSQGEYNFALCCLKGEGIDQDYEKAVEYFMRSAKQGNVGAKTALGFCYEKDQGVDISLSTETRIQEALKWYSEASQQGDDIARQRLEKLQEKINARKPRP